MAVYGRAREQFVSIYRGADLDGEGVAALRRRLVRSNNSLVRRARVPRHMRPSRRAAMRAQQGELALLACAVFELEKMLGDGGRRRRDRRERVRDLSDEQLRGAFDRGAERVKLAVEGSWDEALERIADASVLGGGVEGVGSGGASSGGAAGG